MVTSTHRNNSLSLKLIFREAFAYYKVYFFLLTALAILVFLIPSIITASLEPVNLDPTKTPNKIRIIIGVIISATSHIGGEIFLQGLVAQLIKLSNGNAKPAVKTNPFKLITSLPWRKLILLDIIIGVGTVLGLALIILPGVIFYLFCSLSPALLELEHLSIKQSLRYSFRIVFRNFFKVLISIGLITFLIEVFTSFITTEFPYILDTLAEDFVYTMIGPILSVFTVLLAYYGYQQLEENHSQSRKN